MKTKSEVEERSKCSDVKAELMAQYHAGSSVPSFCLTLYLYGQLSLIYKLPTELSTASVFEGSPLTPGPGTFWTDYQ